MRTAVFLYSRDGLGHQVRCGALADELRSRGWSCLDAEWMGKGAIDVLVVDYPCFYTSVPWKVVRITDIRGGYPADLTLSGRELIRPEFSAVTWTGGNGPLDIRGIVDVEAADLAAKIATASLVVTYGGMRAMEAVCVGAPVIVLPRNEGERSNVEFLRGGGHIDGLGCKRAADAIERLVI